MRLRRHGRTEPDRDRRPPAPPGSGAAAGSHGPSTIITRDRDDVPWPLALASSPAARPGPGGSESGPEPCSVRPGGSSAVTGPAPRPGPPVPASPRRATTRLSVTLRVSISQRTQLKSEVDSEGGFKYKEARQVWPPGYHRDAGRRRLPGSTHDIQLALAFQSPPGLGAWAGLPTKPNNPGWRVYQGPAGP